MFLFNIIKGFKMLFLDKNVTEEVINLERIADCIEVYLPKIEMNENYSNEDGTKALISGCYEPWNSTDGTQLMFLKNLVNLIREPRKIVTTGSAYLQTELVKSLYILAKQCDIVEIMRSLFTGNKTFSESYYKEFFDFICKELVSDLDNLGAALSSYYKCFENYRNSLR